MSDERVELHQAYMWDCPECGRENFCRAIKAELSREEQEEILRANGEFKEWEQIPDDVGVDALMAPKEVACKSCGAKFTCSEDGDGEAVS